MPSRDKTGPTGRGMGTCGNNTENTNFRNGFGRFGFGRFGSRGMFGFGRGYNVETAPNDEVQSLRDRIASLENIIKNK